ncbi:MAG: C39 family peptidase [Vicinamibacterales bacterium]
MQRSTRIAAWLAAALVGAGAVVDASAGPDASRGATASRRLLDVPYLPQTEDLCGGAAVAMVLRYWGEPRVYPGDFAALVERELGGIRTDVLLDAVRQRGWLTLPRHGATADDVAALGTEIAAGRPVVVLIAVGAGRYHYVVMVAATDDHVVVHDPARAPFRVLTRAAFDEAWAAAGRWAVTILPDGSAPSRRGGTTDLAAAPTAVAVGATPACGRLVDEMVATARAGDLDGAASGLETATALCPEAAAAWRELAGVRFLQSRWRDAAADAAHAARLEPDDTSGWDLLATSQFLDGRPLEALRAWNRIDRPRVDVVAVAGARRTRHPVVAERVGLDARSLLTPERLARAERRLDALPSARTTDLRYRPIEGGLATVDAVIVERPLVPSGPLAAVAAVGHAAVYRELRLDVASPTGSGELWSAGWRWWGARPRVAVGLATPAPGPLPGIATVEGLWERATYARAESAPGGPAVARQTRRRAGFGLTDWATSRIRWRAGLAFDRWDDARFASAAGGLDLRVAGDRVATLAEVGVWAPLSGGRGFARLELTAALRSTRAADRPVWRLTTALTVAGDGAPFDLWAGAGIGVARTPLLRAHPLLEGGVVTGAVFGRQLVAATAEHERPLVAIGGARFGVAVFADAAHAARRSATAAAWHLDAGAGVRLAIPGAGVVRVDLARGLRDRRHAVSAGWVLPWPGR